MSVRSRTLKRKGDLLTGNGKKNYVRRLGRWRSSRKRSCGQFSEFLQLEVPVGKPGHPSYPEPSFEQTLISSRSSPWTTISPSPASPVIDRTFSVKSLPSYTITVSGFALTSKFLIAASAFAFFKFSQAIILSSSLLLLQNFITKKYNKVDHNNTTAWYNFFTRIHQKQCPNSLGHRFFCLWSYIQRLLTLLPLPSIPRTLVHSTWCILLRPPSHSHPFIYLHISHIRLGSLHLLDPRWRGRWKWHLLGRRTRTSIRTHLCGRILLQYKWWFQGASILAIWKFNQNMNKYKLKHNFEKPLMKGKTSGREDWIERNEGYAR